MLRRHGALIISLFLVLFVAGACLVRTTGRPARRGQPAYAEKHKHGKHQDKKQKKWKKQKEHKKHKD
ncbi:MAG: hypothetical protein H0T89_30735 [Deltaproteobacteria bacterium]|nr:hypothetical protein [Deltaproteobacteria bacterium]MDQ3298529.1 hypothetical protein [Myxococcota bacterium]